MNYLAVLIMILISLNQKFPEDSVHKKLPSGTTYSHVAVYNLKYQSDSTNPVTKDAITVLLLGDKVSLFGAYGNINVDTALYLDKKRGGKKWNFKLQPPPDYYINYRIFKENLSVTTYDRLALIEAPIFTYNEYKADMRWIIMDDTATISGYHCQKASCNFGNRSWYAWFTMDIPISDGPYKFCGLPGLIIQVNDTNNYWNFTLTSFENKVYEYYEEIIRNKDAVSTSKAKFMNLLKSSYDNGFEMEQQYGLVFNNKIEETRQEYRDRARKENNWIEKSSTK